MLSSNVGTLTRSFTPGGPKINLLFFDFLQLIAKKMWDWVLRHRRQRTQLRSGHVGNSYSVKLLSLARTLQTLKVNYYFECLHLSQDCDVFAEALSLSSSTPGLRDRKPRLSWSSRTAMYVNHLIFCFSISCKFIFWRYWRIIETGNKSGSLSFLWSLPKPL